MCGVKARISLATAIFAALAVAGSIVSIESHAARAKPRPNVMVIETDDQTLEEMRVMRNTLALIGRQGTTFDNNFVTLSLCCPSRSTFLTGQYAHNHGVLTNATPNGGSPGSTTRTRSPSGCRTRATTRRSSAST